MLFPRKQQRESTFLTLNMICSCLKITSSNIWSVKWVLGADHPMNRLKERNVKAEPRVEQYPAKSPKHYYWYFFIDGTFPKMRNRSGLVSVFKAQPQPLNTMWTQRLQQYLGSRRATSSADCSLHATPALLDGSEMFKTG